MGRLELADRAGPWLRAEQHGQQRGTGVAGSEEIGEAGHEMWQRRFGVSVFPCFGVSVLR
jgi:hypothetical protein